MVCTRVSSHGCARQCCASGSVLRIDLLSRCAWHGSSINNSPSTNPPSTSPVNQPPSTNPHQAAPNEPLTHITRRYTRHQRPRDLRCRPQSDRHTCTACGWVRGCSSMRLEHRHHPLVATARPEAWSPELSGLPPAHPSWPSQHAYRRALCSWRSGGR